MQQPLLVCFRLRNVTNTLFCGLSSYGPLGNIHTDDPILFYSRKLIAILICSKTIIWTFSGNGITGGVHRLWAHRSYKASYPLRLFLMISNSIANQGSIWHWARDHRVHHKHSEVRKSYIFHS